MKRAYRLVAVSVLAAAFLLPIHAFAQAAAPAAGGKLVQVKRIDAAKPPTPEYQLVKGGTVARTKTWFSINTSYKTDPDWIDEVSFTYYIVCKGKLGPQAGKYTLFKGDVTYINVQKGDHKSDVYLHPSTLARYGDVERVGVVVSVQGRVVDMESQPSVAGRWWEQLQPVEGYVLNRMQTPFAMINFDDYEAIKGK